MLKSLSDIFCIAGAEDGLIKYIIEKIPCNDAYVKIDGMNNLVVSCMRDKSLPTVILSAHMDEPGFIVTDITDEGYFKFEIIGEIKPSDIISKKVKINDITGIISLKAIHLTTKEEREKPVKISDLFIDVGAKTKEDAHKVAIPGDYCCFSSVFSEFGESLVKGKALSSRVGCKALINIINNNEFSGLNLICMFTTQKEISSRGALVALNDIDNADFSIIIDSVDVAENVKLSKGVVVGYRTDDNVLTRDLIKLIENTGLKNSLSIQKMCCDKVKSDLNSFKSCRADIPSTILALPCKYKNTATEVMSESDISTLYESLYSILSEVNNGTIL